MKAYELHPREGLDSLVLVDRAPPALGDHDVRVKVRAVSLNYRDLVMARIAGKRTKPVIPASDGAGEVVAVGAAVTRVKVGDRVAANFFPTWIEGGLRQTHHDHALGGSIDGMLAEEVVLHESSWVQVPAHLSFEEASTLPCAGLTAWHALFEATTTKPGDVVVVQGTGGVSIFALQLARAAGATVIATTGSPAKKARLAPLGASSVIDYKETPAWGAAAFAASGKDGADVVVEIGGAGTFDESVKALRFGGTLSLIGVLAGVQGNVNTHAVLHKTVRVQGVYVGSVKMFEDFNAALTAAKIAPVIDRTFAFDETRAAYAHLASGAHFGKVVIKL